MMRIPCQIYHIIQVAVNRHWVQLHEGHTPSWNVDLQWCFWKDTDPMGRETSLYQQWMTVSNSNKWWVLHICQCSFYHIVENTLTWIDFSVQKFKMNCHFYHHCVVLSDSYPSLVFYPDPFGWQVWHNQRHSLFN